MTTDQEGSLIFSGLTPGHLTLKVSYIGFQSATRYNGMIHDFVLLNAIHDVPGVQAGLKEACGAICVALKQ